MGDQEPAYLRDVIAILRLDYGCRLLARPGRVARMTAKSCAARAGIETARSTNTSFASF